ncbi:hypothetical protein A374_06451 [Fictibacillus macauensis ZFHKF-1]|uniref:Aminoglycoside phosphotransferase domain-containing protein n=1 Tax=Fictibacillus macauensis ZFHKF-1 TaxID=1196324 RepID=I8UHB6_9BACL|nr:phosphotransferase [Fictibacillus macauensis]EIT86218.1 hypothetical protein A374_06451 [Fictibacillus macauensis ZFHKF-1]
MYTTDQLYEQFKRIKANDKLSKALGEPVTIDPTSITSLKATDRSAIYQLSLATKQGTLPIVFKIFSAGKHKNDVEINMYKRAYKVMKSFLPTVYHMEAHGNDTWVFMEYVRQVRGQVTFTPQHFDYIIPSLAKLHASTFESRFTKREKYFSPWLPLYHSSMMTQERQKQVKKTIELLQRAKDDAALEPVISPYYTSLMSMLAKGPDFFPELLRSGSAITHSDLHMQNICTHDATKSTAWDIQWIDWESAKYGPVWFDLVILVEILIAFRKDWHAQGESIRRRAVDVYTKEMARYGIRFKGDALKLYKMAYCQRTLERGLHTQLRRYFEQRGGELLPYHLEKVTLWCKELGLT